MDRTVDVVLTTELDEPFPWLSGGELVLTTGMRLPSTAAGRAAYLRGLDDCGVAALGFGIGFGHERIPDDLTAVADEIGLPLFEVPLPTPFAAIVKRVAARIAELRYDEVLRASRAQPRMTRALITAGAQAIVRELAAALGATVLVLDRSGAVVRSQPRALDSERLRAVRAALAVSATSGVHTDSTGMSITYQRIGIGRRPHGDLVVLRDEPLGHIDQILLGHANSLLALDYEKPARLGVAQQRLNSHALGLLLGAEVDTAPAWAQLAQAADAQGHIRVLVAECDSDAAAATMHEAIAEVVTGAGYPPFLYLAEGRVVSVLPGASAAFVPRLHSETRGRVRKFVRLGMSGPHRVHALAEAVSSARLAATMAERGGAPTEFAALTGRSLLSIDATREVLDAMGRTVLAPIVDYDAVHGTELLTSLRAFLEANGQWESAAAATGVHRHTLRKRIATSANLLDCDLDSARVRAELLLALLARGE